MAPKVGVTKQAVNRWRVATKFGRG